MAVLVVGEHDGAALKPATLSAITAAAKLGGGIAVLVAGSGCKAAAEAAAKVAGVERVLLADDPLYAHLLAENIAKLGVSLAGGFTHLLAGADSFGKNVMPRIAALLDVAQVSDIVAIEGPKVFVRPIYAGNALQTVEATDEKVVVTVRATAFEPAAAEGGSKENGHAAIRIKDHGMPLLLSGALNEPFGPSRAIPRPQVPLGIAALEHNEAR